MDSPLKQPWSVEFDVPTGDEVQAEFDEEVRRYTPEWKTYIARLERKHRLLILTGAICLPAGIALIVYSPHALSMATGLGSMQVLLCVVGVLSLIGLIESSRMLRQASDPNPTGRKNTESVKSSFRLCVSDAGVLFDWPHFESLLRWVMYYEVMVLPSFVAVMCVSDGTAVIPNTCFASDAAREDFITCVRGLIAANGATAEDRVRANLRDRSFPCPKCRYELRDNQTGACPECGLELTLLNVPNAKDPSLILQG